MLSLLFVAAVAGDVVLGPSSCAPALLDTVAAELRAAGFGDGGPHIATIHLRCEEDASHVLVRVEDEVTQKTVERVVAISAEPRGQARVAVQVVELLHASLAEARFASLVNVPPPVERFLDERERERDANWHAELGGGAMVAPGQFGIEPAVSAALWRIQAMQGWRLELGVLVDVTVRATRWRALGGSADVGLVAPRVGVGMGLDVLGLAVSPRLGLGALLVWASGSADPLWEAHAGALPTFAVSAGVSVTRAVTSWLSLGVVGDASVTPWPISVVMPDSTTRIGLPYFSFALQASFR